MREIAGSAMLVTVEKIDRKSTRLNSSHSQISYAVFCLKKKKNKQEKCIEKSQQISITPQYSHLQNHETNSTLPIPYITAPVYTTRMSAETDNRKPNTLL